MGLIPLRVLLAPRLSDKGATATGVADSCSLLSSRQLCIDRIRLGFLKYGCNIDSSFIVVMGWSFVTILLVLVSFRIKLLLALGRVLSTIPGFCYIEQTCGRLNESSGTYMQSFDSFAGLVRAGALLSFRSGFYQADRLLART